MSSLHERLRKASTAQQASALSLQYGRVKEEVEVDPYQDLKTRIHQKLIDRLDLSHMDTMSSADLQQEIRGIVQTLLAQEQTPISSLERETLITEVQNETLGLGPLEPLLHDTTISDILVNNHRQVYVERFGKLEKTAITFKSEEHLKQIIDRIVQQVGRRIDEASPMVDARLPDGSRVNAVIPPIALDGASLSIRRFSIDPFEMRDLISFQTLTPSMAELLQAGVRGRLNVLVSGGTGTGKTTLLNVLSSFVPHTERLLTIEDAAELQLQQPHVIRLETRPPNIEGRGEITARDLVRNALRMRPDRIVLGEVRGGEALDMLQAMNTGHEGSITTLHANTPRDAVSRLETMVLMAGMDLPVMAVREQIVSAIDLIVQISRFSDGSRKVTQLSEVLHMERETVVMQDIFTFEQTDVDATGKVLGRHKATGVRPQFLDKLAVKGFALNSSLFRVS